MHRQARSGLEREIRNKHAQVLAACLPRANASFNLENITGILFTVQTKTVTNFKCFPNFPSKQQHFNVTNGKPACCTIFVGNHFFSDKI